ncbi:MAG TPA: amidase family protein [Rhizomicrobium sp.]|nr:amidase family protein [Rhizomicrobium sp.]
MAIREYGTFDGLGLAALVARKEVSPSELLEEAISRAEALNPRLNAIVFKAYDLAREAAKTAPRDGLFAGVPTLLKDMRAGATGMPTRSGSRLMPPAIADHDSVLVASFRKAGMVPFGKTNVPEFGILPTTESRLYGAAHNPWSLAHSTGGSSGGSAAAVAARIVPLAHATDGGGSIRIPASCCGLVGLKVSRGRVSQGPDASDSTSGLSVDHVVSRSVRDCAAALDVDSRIDYGDPYFAPPADGSYLEAISRKPKRLRIAASFTRADGTPLHPDVTAALRKTAKLCESLGHIVEEAAPPLNPAELTTAFMTIWADNTAMGVALLAQKLNIEPSTDVVEGLTLSLYEQGMKITAVQHMLAQQLMFRVARTMAAFHETHDTWLCATLGLPPIGLGTIDVDERDVQKAFAPLLGYVPYTAMQNATGQPAINVPLHWNESGLPIGVQFVARNGNEALLLQLAAQLEEAAPWISRTPPL